MQLFWIARRHRRRPKPWSPAMAPASTPPSRGTLKGKKVGVPFVSTTHFHLLFALEHLGHSARPRSRSSTCSRRRSPPPGSAATSTRRSSGTRPSARIKKSGKVDDHLGRAVSAQGKADLRWPGRQCVSSPSQRRGSWPSSYASSPTPMPPIASTRTRWTADSPIASRRSSSLLGGEPAQVVAGAGPLRFPDHAEEQASCTLARLAAPRAARPRR